MTTTRTRLAAQDRIDPIAQIARDLDREISEILADDARPLTGLAEHYVTLGAELASIPVPHIPVTPYGDDFRMAARHWQQVGAKFLEYAAAFGREVKSNSPFPFDEDAFTNLLAGAVTDMTLELLHVADRLDQDRRR